MPSKDKDILYGVINGGKGLGGMSKVDMISSIFKNLKKIMTSFMNDA